MFVYKVDSLWQIKGPIFPNANFRGEAAKFKKKKKMLILQFSGVKA